MKDEVSVNQLWKDLFAKPHEWWDIRLKKGNSTAATAFDQGQERTSKFNSKGVKEQPAFDKKQFVAFVKKYIKPLSATSGGCVGLMGLISQAVYDGGRHVLGALAGDADTRVQFTRALAARVLRGKMDLPPLPLEFSPSPPSKLFSRSRRKLKTNMEEEASEHP